MNFKNELEKSIPENVKLTVKEKETIRYRVRQSSHTSKFHLKPVFISVLFIMIASVLVLSSIQAIVKEEKASNQMIISDTNHSSSRITEDQKQQYYGQYIKIVEQAMEQKVGLSISVPPIEEFKESDWIVSEEYEKMIQNIIDMHLTTERENIAAMSSNLDPAVTTMNGETTKSTYIYFPDILREIEVTTKFDTQYSTEFDRQLFVGLDNVSTKLKSSPGTWEQTSYQASLVDGGKKYSIRIEGIFKLNDLSFEKVFTINFKCDEFGNIY